MNFWDYIFGKKKKEKEVTPMKPIPFKDQTYWETKHPKVEQLYSGRPIPGNRENIDYDIRHFIWSDDIILQKTIKAAGLLNGSIDEVAQKCQQFVVSSIEYVSDETVGATEFWLLPTETLIRGKGDCEDGAMLLASLLLNCLPPEEHWRVRVSAGFVQSSPTAPQGGHAYCTYCRAKDNEWVILDWCYLEDSQTPVRLKPLQKDNPPYKDIWFSFNCYHAWAHVNFALNGRIKGIS